MSTKTLFVTIQHECASIDVYLKSFSEYGKRSTSDVYFLNLVHISDITVDCVFNHSFVKWAILESLLRLFLSLSCAFLNHLYFSRIEIDFACELWQMVILLLYESLSCYRDFIAQPDLYFLSQKSKGFRNVNWNRFV